MVRKINGMAGQKKPVYEQVFDDHPDYETCRAAVWDRHRVREAFRVARAYDRNALVGFAYGYTGESGKRWTNNARKALKPAVADAWVDTSSWSASAW